jgi:hypothetical protein
MPQGGQLRSLRRVDSSDAFSPPTSELMYGVLLVRKADDDCAAQETIPISQDTRGGQVHGSTPYHEATVHVAIMLPGIRHPHSATDRRATVWSSPKMQCQSLSGIPS